MVPILFPKDSTFESGIFNTNGIGRLTGVTEAYVEEERNGAYELEFKMIAGSSFSEYVEIGSLIAVTSFKGSGRQIFEVYRINKTIDGYIEVSCMHISYRTSFMPVKAFTLNSASLNTICTNLKNNLLETGINFIFDVDTAHITRTVKYEQKYPMSLRKRLSDEEGCILKLFEEDKIEFEWDNNHIKIWKNRGTDTGVELRRGKNIVSLEAENDSNETITGVLPYWIDSKGTTVVYGDIQYSATQSDYAYNRTVPIDFSSDFKSKPTKAQLNDKGQKYFTDELINPETNLTVNYVDLRNTIDYKNIAPYEDIKLCDIVRVVYPQLNVSYSSKVTKLKWNVLAERNEEIELGEAKKLSSSISSSLNYMDISGMSEFTSYQNSVNNEQEEINEELGDRITGNEEYVSGLDASFGDLSDEVAQHDVTVQQVNSYFTFSDVGLIIKTSSQSIRTVYTANGFEIQDSNGTVLASATVNEFNCPNGIGLGDWHIDKDNNILSIYRKI